MCAARHLCHVYNIVSWVMDYKAAVNCKKFVFKKISKSAIVTQIGSIVFESIKL